jgi:hypothetical protein
MLLPIMSVTRQTAFRREVKVAQTGRSRSSVVTRTSCTLFGVVTKADANSISSFLNKSAMADILRRLIMGSVSQRRDWLGMSRSICQRRSARNPAAENSSAADLVKNTSRATIRQEPR